MALQIEGKKIYDKESETTSGGKTKQRNRLLRNITLNYINTAITNLNMQSAVWVLYLAYCGLNLAQIGFVEGIYHATSIVFEIPSGVVADLLGRKRSMILSKIWHVFFNCDDSVVPICWYAGGTVWTYSSTGGGWGIINSAYARRKIETDFLLTSFSAGDKLNYN